MASLSPEERDVAYFGWAWLMRTLSHMEEMDAVNKARIRRSAPPLKTGSRAGRSPTPGHASYHQGRPRTAKNPAAAAGGLGDEAVVENGWNPFAEPFYPVPFYASEPDEELEEEDDDTGAAWYDYGFDGDEAGDAAYQAAVEYFRQKHQAGRRAATQGAREPARSGGARRQRGPSIRQAANQARQAAGQAARRAAWQAPGRGRGMRYEDDDEDSDDDEDYVPSGSGSDSPWDSDSEPNAEYEEEEEESDSDDDEEEADDDELYQAGYYSPRYLRALERYRSQIEALEEEEHKYHVVEDDSADEGFEQWDAESDAEDLEAAHKEWHDDEDMLAMGDLEIDGEIERDLDEIDAAIYADTMEPARAMPLDAELERDMREIENAMYGESMAPQQAMSLEAEIERDLDQVNSAIYGESMLPARALPVDAEIERDMDEVLDTIEGETFMPHPAMGVDVEVERDMDEILGQIEAQQLTPRQAMPIDAEIEKEMREVNDYIDMMESRRSGRAALRQGRTAPGQLKVSAPPFYPWEQHRARM